MSPAETLASMTLILREFLTTSPGAPQTTLIMELLRAGFTSREINANFDEALLCVNVG